MALLKSIRRGDRVGRNDGTRLEVDQPYPDLDRVYRRHAETVSCWIRRLWGPSDAQDLLHEVFLVVQRQLPDFRGDAPITTWLYAITVRVVIDRRRKDKWRRLIWQRAESELQTDQPPVETPLGTVLRERATRAVYAILEGMSERDRTLLILFELEGLPAQEISKVLAMSEGNVWVALHRARSRFRSAYLDRFEEPAPGVEDAEKA
jgi:RNA polymerase sigma-70 factor (ECF subfamily)